MMSVTCLDFPTEELPIRRSFTFIGGGAFAASFFGVGAMIVIISSNNVQDFLCCVKVCNSA